MLSVYCSFFPCSRVVQLRVRVRVRVRVRQGVETRKVASAREPGYLPTQQQCWKYGEDTQIVRYSTRGEVVRRGSRSAAAAATSSHIHLVGM